MRVDISEEQITDLDDYASISIAFEVSSVLDVIKSDESPGAFVITERMLDVPYIKDYDAINGGNPAFWPRHFDVSNWGLLVARIEGHRVAGAALAVKTPALTMLEGRADVAVLWDIRVAPLARKRGVGSALFRAVESSARGKGYKQLKVETQNINVAACRFYARQGCVLAAVNSFAYSGLPNETPMLWYKDIAQLPTSG